MCSKSEILEFWNDKCESSKENFDALLHKNITPFIGAGMSVSFGYSTWGGFLNDIISSFPDDDVCEFQTLLDNKEYLLLAEKIDVYLNNGIVEKVRERFMRSKIKQPRDNYVKLLKRMKIQGFITTNYDSVVETQYGNPKLKIVLPGNINNAITLDRNNTPYILKLHGSYDNPNSIILTEQQYTRQYKNSSDFINVFKYFWACKTFLFIGCGLEKDYLIEQINSLAGSQTDIWHYAIVEMPKTENRRKKKEVELTRLKIRPIWYPNGQHNSVYAILSLLYENKSNLLDSEMNNSELKEKLIQQSNNYIDTVAKQAYEKGMQNVICQAILEQCNPLGRNKFKLEDISLKIETFDEQCLFVIDGEPGTGKSTLISLLYQEELDRLYEVIPVLIDLHYYDGYKNDIALAQLKGHLSLIDEVINSGEKVLFFIDGLNRYKRANDSLQKEICVRITDWKRNKNVYFVYSIGDMPANNYPPFIIDAHIGVLPRSKNKIVLKAIDVRKKEFNRLLKNILSFYSIQPVVNADEHKQSRNDSMNDNFTTCCKRVSGNYVEFRTVNFLANAYLVYNEALFKQPIGEIYTQYYLEKLGYEELLKTAEYVANFMLNKFIQPCSSSYYMVYKSPTMRDFLFAYYYVELLKRGDIEKLKIFDCIFTPCINRFVLDFITKDLLTEVTIMDQIRSRFSVFTLQQKNQVVYLIGRLKTDQAKQEASTFLQELYTKELKRFESKQGNITQSMYFRTIGVSMIYLGNLSQEDDFYFKLIYNPYMRKINRNFHMIYYTTESYKIGEDLKLSSVNCSGKDINALYQFLYRSITTGKDKAKRCLNIITLLNLVVYDHYYNKMNDKNFNPYGFNKLIEALRTDDSITNQILKDYILNVGNYLLEKNVYTTVLERTYQLKRIQRAGWLEPGRDINKKEEPESVADHTWGCCQLAFMFLTENMRDCDFMDQNDFKYEKIYSRERIILLLLFHDLPEVCTGDKSSLRKNKKDKELESQCICSMEVLDSFPYFHSFHDMSKYWNEYEAHKTFNARIAYDIDKLEPLVQFYMYRNLLPMETCELEKEKWINDVNTKLKTNFGRNLFAFIRRHFLDETFA